MNTRKNDTTPTATDQQPALEPADNLPTATGTALAVTGPAGVLAAFHADEWADVDDGLVGMEHIGYQMPRLVSDMRPGGGWLDETTGEKVDHLNVVWLTSAPGRAYWSQPFGKGDTAPDCRSADMVTPDPSSPNVQAGSCAACPHSKWGDDGKQACSTRIHALVFDTEAQHLARLSFGVTAIKRVRTYLSTLKAMVPPRPPISVVTNIKLEEVERDSMRWLEPVITVGEPLARADAQPLVRLRDDFVAQWRSAMAADLAEPDSDVRVADGPFDEPPSGTIPPHARPADHNGYHTDEEPF